MVTSASLTLVLGATGKTGSRVASRLLSRGLPVRTAARSGADAHFDWDDPETYAPALPGVNRVYLLGPVMRTHFADQVSAFLDQAEAVGARHVTYLLEYTDIDRGEWVAGAVAGGVPAEYGAVLSVLTETIASGRGSRPSNDIEKAASVPPASFADFARRTAAAWAMDETR